MPSPPITPGWPDGSPRPIREANIPEELKELDQWVCWRPIVRDGKATKVPFRAELPEAEASTIERRSWASFKTSLEAFRDEANRFWGIGFVFTPNDPFTGVDLDRCLTGDGRAIEVWAREILDKVPGYTEISPSGRGLKVFTRATTPEGKGRKRGGFLPEGGAVECYDRGRYFTVTGRVFEGRRTIAAPDRPFDEIHAEIFRPRSKAKARSAGAGPGAGTTLDLFSALVAPPHPGDWSLVAKAMSARNGPEFSAYWRGEWNGQPSQSEADLGLLSHLAFWTGGDVHAMDRLFRQSGLMSGKWGERADYRESTIAKALDRDTFYDPNYRSANGHANGHATEPGPPGGPPRMPGDEGPDPDDAIARRTDLGNALRLVNLCGEEIRYCYPWGKWLAWSGDRWQADETGLIYRHARRVVAQLHDEARAEPDEAARKAKVAWAMTCESEARINAMASMARHEATIPVLPEQLDAHPLLLNCPNGTVDLTTGRIGPHVRGDLMTRRTGSPFVPEATCPVWEAFLDRVMGGSREMVAFLRRAVGYSLSGDVSEHALFFLYGRGRNGKSTFLNAVLRCLGDYAITINADLLTAKNQDEHPTGVADLQGRRFVATIEVEDGRKMAESLVKTLTGGDKIRARRMRQDFYEFDPTHKLWMAANHKPTIKGTDEGIWRRIKLVPFSVEIPAQEVDRGLPARLLAESPGILAWAVRGLAEWRAGGLQEPDAVREATAEYREEMDLMADFIADRCVVMPAARVLAEPLYRCYSHWCKVTGVNPVTMNKFGRLMTERGFTIDKKNSRNIRTGIGLKDPESGREGGRDGQTDREYEGSPDSHY